MIKVIFVCFSLITTSNLFAQTWYESLKSEDKVAVDKIIKHVEERAKSRHFEVLTEMPEIEAKVAVYFLYFQYIRCKAEANEEAVAAKAALKNVKGAAQYLRGILDRLHAERKAYIDDFYEDEVWQVLEFVGGMEAAKVVAPYLFRSGGFPSAHMYYEYQSMAAATLERMKIPGSPVTPEDPTMWYPLDVGKWRKWAIEKKLVASEIVAKAPKLKPLPPPVRYPPAPTPSPSNTNVEKPKP